MLTMPLILAAVSAGLIGGVHCVGMCGGIASMLSRLPQITPPAPHAKRKIIPIATRSEIENIRDVGRQSQLTRNADVDTEPYKSSELTWFYQVRLHTGRLSTYMLIGAIFGGVGEYSLRWKSQVPISSSLFFIGNLALILLALRLLGLRLQAIFPQFISRAIQAAYAAIMPAMRAGSRYPFWMGMSWGGLPCGLSYAVAPFALLSGQAWSGAVLMLIFGIAALPHLLIAQSVSYRWKQQGWMRIVQILIAVILLGLGVMGIFYFDMKNMPDFLCVTPEY